jgi:Cys-tRNA(Pro) deacylase
VTARSSKPAEPVPRDNPHAIAPAVAALVTSIRERGVDVAILAPGIPMPTVPSAAAAIGVREDQIIKSLLFGDGRDRYVLAIASGVARIDRQALAKATGLEGLRLADPSTVAAVTGFPAGGVPPVGHRTPLRVVIDRRAAALDVVYGGAGTEHCLLRIRPADIIRLAGAEVADILATDS